MGDEFGIVHVDTLDHYGAPVVAEEDDLGDVELAEKSSHVGRCGLVTIGFKGIGRHAGSVSLTEAYHVRYQDAEVEVQEGRDDEAP